MKSTYQFDLECIEYARNLDNFKIIHGDIKNGKCIIYFSGNGLYYPNSEFQLNSVIDNDRYEWINLAPKTYEKIIFIRDVYKQWYVKGINNRLTSIETLKEFINGQINGYHSTFVGSSAGGYAAVLFGNLCSADIIISLSGQFDLKNEKLRSKANKLLHEYSDEKYLDLSLCENHNVIYFYPSLSEQDIYQMEVASRNCNITIVEIVSPVHGVPFFPFAIKNILSLDLEELKELSCKKHNMLYFSIRFCNVLDLVFWVNMRMKKFISNFTSKLYRTI
jgi:hypothetical protein